MDVDTWGRNHIHVIKISKNNLLGQIFSKGNGFIFGLFLQIMNCNFKWQFVFLVSHFFDCFCSNHKYQLFGNDINNCFIQRVDVVIIGKFGSIFTSIGNILSEERKISSINTKWHGWFFYNLQNWTGSGVQFLPFFFTFLQTKLNVDWKVNYFFKYFS